MLFVVGATAWLSDGAILAAQFYRRIAPGGPKALAMLLIRIEILLACCLFSTCASAYEVNTLGFFRAPLALLIVCWLLTGPPVMPGQDKENIHDSRPGHTDGTGHIVSSIFERE